MTDRRVVADSWSGVLLCWLAPPRIANLSALMPPEVKIKGVTIAEMARV